MHVLPLRVASQFEELFAFVDQRVARPAAETLRMILLSLVEFVANAGLDAIAAPFATRGYALVALLTGETFQRRIEVATQRTSAFGALETILMVGLAAEDRAGFGSAETFAACGTAIAEMGRCHSERERRILPNGAIPKLI